MKQSLRFYPLPLLLLAVLMMMAADGACAGGAWSEFRSIRRFCVLFFFLVLLLFGCAVVGCFHQILDYVGWQMVVVAFFKTYYFHP